MAVTVADCEYPKGELTQAMFPDGDLVLNLGIWLAEAQAKITSDTAVKAWVHYRGFTAVANRIAATPSDQRDFNDRSTAWSDNRVKGFRDQAQSHLDVYNGILASAGAKSPARMAVY
jgi:hypothetical protein